MPRGPSKPKTADQRFVSILASLDKLDARRLSLVNEAKDLIKSGSISKPLADIVSDAALVAAE
ncbi:MAG TPA: hypothetical protein VLS45_08340 [Methylomicrobium sp.]|nr:hypothetical protein [Methylomicrobium sp.]